MSNLEKEGHGQRNIISADKRSSLLNQNQFPILPGFRLVDSVMSIVKTEALDNDFRVKITNPDEVLEIVDRHESELPTFLPADDWRPHFKSLGKENGQNLIDGSRERVLRRISNIVPDNLLQFLKQTVKEGVGFVPNSNLTMCTTDLSAEIKAMLSDQPDKITPAFIIGEGTIKSYLNMLMYYGYKAKVDLSYDQALHFAVDQILGHEFGHELIRLSKKNGVDTYQKALNLKAFRDIENLFPDFQDGDYQAIHNERLPTSIEDYVLFQDTCSEIGVKKARRLIEDCLTDNFLNLKNISWLMADLYKKGKDFMDYKLIISALNKLIRDRGRLTRINLPLENVFHDIGYSSLPYTLDQMKRMFY